MSQMHHAPANRAARCLLCGSRGDDKLRLAAGIHIRRCTPCSLSFTDPPPEVSYEHYTTDGDRDFKLWMRFARPIVRYATRLAPAAPSSWLDFGAGSGELVLTAKLAGMEAVGVELDIRASAAAERRGARLVKSLSELSGQRFDVVSVSHVLEHLPDPIQVLAELGSRHLAWNGVLVVVQPNRDGLLPRLWPDRWGGWVWNEHLWHLTPRSMATVMDRAGLSVVGLRSTTLCHRVTTIRSVVPAVVGRIAAHIRQGDAFFMAATHPGPVPTSNHSPGSR